MSSISAAAVSGAGAARLVARPTLQLARPAGAVDWGGGGGNDGRKAPPLTLPPLVPTTDFPQAPVTAEAIAALPPRLPATRSRYVCVSETLLYLTMLGILVAAGFIIWSFAVNGAATVDYAWAVSGIFVCFSVALCVHDIHMHITHYVSPLQRYYVRIIAMIVIYSIESWLALRFIEDRVYFECARDMYEAFVIYSVRRARGCIYKKQATA